MTRTFKMMQSIKVISHTFNKYNHDDCQYKHKKRSTQSEVVIKVVVIVIIIIVTVIAVHGIARSVNMNTCHIVKSNYRPIARRQVRVQSMLLTLPKVEVQTTIVLLPTIAILLMMMNIVSSKRANRMVLMITTTHNLSLHKTGSSFTKEKMS